MQIVGVPIPQLAEQLVTRLVVVPVPRNLKETVEVLPSVPFPRRVPLPVAWQQLPPVRPLHGVDADPDVVATDPGIHVSCRSG